MLEAVESAVHQLLHARKVYPETYFEKRGKYGMQVWRCRHPDVGGYVTRVLENIEPLLRAGAVQEVIFSVCDGAGAFVDQVAFRFHSPQSTSMPSSSSSSSASMGNGGATATSIASRTSLDHLQQQLRALLLQLSITADAMGPFKAGYVWDLCVLLTPTAAVGGDPHGSVNSTHSPNAVAAGQAAVLSALDSHQWIVGSPCTSPSPSPSLSLSHSQSDGAKGAGQGAQDPRGVPSGTSGQVLRNIVSPLFSCDVVAYRRP
jgi:hypothetical protein